MAKKKSPKVALFATCLVDSMRPSVGFSAITLLEQAGCQVSVPQMQSCCGQPAYNSGDKESARKIITPLFDEFADYDYVVIPSASCAGMFIKHVPTLFPKGDAWHEAALAFSKKCYELIYFLSHIMKLKPQANLKGKATYHSSCSSLREIGLTDEPKKMLKSVKGLQFQELPDAEVCCGFGGLFCMKYAPISQNMVDEKCKNIKMSGADILLSGDLGCLLNIAGRLQRQGSAIKSYHIAEILAGVATSAIGEEE